MRSEKPPRKSSTTVTFTDRWRCRPLSKAEIPAAAALVREVFEEHVAPLYDATGVASFLDYIDEQALVRRAGRDHVLVGAEEPDTGTLLGVLELRRYAHIALLFVRTEHQGQGVGRALLRYAEETARGRGRNILTVNATPNAVRAYEALGFAASDGEQEQNGIRSVPMIRSISEHS
ncbi:MAG: GNAT family N-acetyltransferase [Spirochaetaceae bacterium]